MQYELTLDSHPTQGAGRPFDFQKNSPLLGHVFFDAE